MRQELKHIVKQSAKIAGITCVVLGSAALVTSGVALKALAGSARYLTERTKKIIGPESAADDEEA